MFIELTEEQFIVVGGRIDDNAGALATTMAGDGKIPAGFLSTILMA